MVKTGHYSCINSLDSSISYPIRCFDLVSGPPRGDTDENLYATLAIGHLKFTEEVYG